MIVDARQLDQNAQIRGKIAIVGGGAAGITLALELSRQFADVILLESGGFEFEPETQTLYEGTVKGQGETDVAFSRLRFLGGTTNHWAGLCVTLDPVNFEKIPGRPYSGWPIQFDELNPFYDRAYPYCEVGFRQVTPRIFEEARPIARQVFDSSELELTELRNSPPTRFGSRYRPELESSDKLKVFLYANVVDISTLESGRAISSIDVQTLTGIRFKVEADAYILCCGGIENPRILLNCNRFFASGIGNQHDLVGRFFMDHLVAETGSIVPNSGDANLGPLENLAGRDGSVTVTVGIKNSAEAIRSRGRIGCQFTMHPKADSEQASKSIGSPAVYAFKRMVDDAMKRRMPQFFEERTCAALDDPGSIAQALYYRMTDAIRGQRATKSILVLMEAEQSPNPDSRVMLSDDLDLLGMKRVILDWRITADDYNNLYQTGIALARGVGAAGFGRMIMHIEPNGDVSRVRTGWHHMGTTRMHDHERQGVVDKNCKVHGIDNLYVAGSSVFPSGGNANPTLTIVAMAIRLADHLKVKV